MDHPAEHGTLHHLRKVVDQVPSMLAYWDCQLRCRFANRAYETWFGADPDKLIGTTLPELLGPALYALNEPHVQGALRGQLQTFERVVPGPDGVQRASLATYQPDIQDGQVLGFIVTVTEITALKQTEARLQRLIDDLGAEVRRRRSAEDAAREVQESLAVTLASIHAGFLATDRHGHVTRLNAVAERLTGWTQDEARGQPLWQVFQREDRPPELLPQNPVDVMAARGMTVDEVHQLVAIARHGAHTPVEVQAALTHDECGAVNGLAMVLRDRSGELRAQADASQLAAIVESSHDAIIGKTLDGTITSWNAGAQALFGYRADEVIGRNVALLIPPGRADEEARILASLARGQRMPAWATERLAKGGRPVAVSITVSPIRDALGRIVGASKIARDISAQRLAEQLAAENRQIQEASRLKSLFLANMSHELRTPLNAVIGFADLLAMGQVAPGSAQHARYVAHIADSGRHLLQLINDVLDLTKVEAGRIDLQPQPLQLVTLVDEVVATLQPTVAQRRARLAVQIDPGLGTLQLDPTRLKQVLYNFLSNALKFGPDGQQVRISARPHGPSHWRLAVADEGPGIPAEQLPRLFVAFQQLDAGYSKQHQGTGLGLALTKQLVEAQGGAVGVHSVPGHGSVFHALLPLVQPPATTATAADDAALRHTAPTAPSDPAGPSAAHKAAPCR